MWKTAIPSWTSNVDESVVALCPQCDALGPHPVHAQAVACIDCGERLGRMTPDGFSPFERDRLAPCLPRRDAGYATTLV